MVDVPRGTSTFFYRHTNNVLRGTLFLYHHRNVPRGTSFRIATATFHVEHRFHINSDKRSTWNASSLRHPTPNLSTKVPRGTFVLNCNIIPNKSIVFLNVPRGTQRKLIKSHRTNHNATAQDHSTRNATQTLQTPRKSLMFVAKNY